MSPIRITQVSYTPAKDYGNPLVGPIDHTVAVPVTLSTMTTREIDAKGFLRPGIPLTKAGAKITAGVAVFGVTVEVIKVADNNAAATIAALGVQNVAVATIGQVNRAIAEDNLEAAYTADEVAGFNLAGSKLVLL